MLPILLATVSHGTPQDAADFDQMVRTIDRRYVYLDRERTDLDAVVSELRPLALAATTPEQRVQVLERVLETLVDPHATLGTNLPSSTRLVPSGLDAWAEIDGATAQITTVRPGWPADQAGIRVGDRIVAIDGVPVAAAIDTRIPCYVDREDPTVRGWALLALLAGTHDRLRTWTLADGRTVSLADPDAMPVPEPVRFERRADGIALIALHALGDDASVPAFDAALEAARDADGLILDLRDTPAGGNTSVAEPMLGRFVRERRAYQRIVPRNRRPWERTVDPRGPWTWDKPAVVLVGRFTGSMGEGMALGFDALGIGTVMGTEMAGLQGAVHTYVLRRSGISWNLPTERLTHLDGTPRERWLPPQLVRPDEAMERAAAWLLGLAGRAGAH